MSNINVKWHCAICRQMVPGQHAPACPYAQITTEKRTTAAPRTPHELPPPLTEERVRQIVREMLEDLSKGGS